MYYNFTRCAPSLNLMSMEVLRVCIDNTCKAPVIASRVTTWRPCDKQIRQGRPAKSWIDDLDKYWRDTIWQRTAQHKASMETAFRPTTGHYSCPMMMRPWLFWSFALKAKEFGWLDLFKANYELLKN